MDESASAGLFEASIQAHEYTVWQHPFRDLRIYMHSAALGAVSTRALQSLKSKEPSEIGGLLRGRTSVGPKGVTAIIDEAEFIRSEGRLYNATRTDYECISRALKSQTIQKSLSVVGYFRSHVREDLCLSTEDKELITRNIREPNSIFLVVRPFDIGMAMAAFFFWENGQLQTDGSDLEVPFLAFEEPIGKSQIFRAHSEVLYTQADSVTDEDSENKSTHQRPRKETPVGDSSHPSLMSPVDRTPSTEQTPVIQIPLGTQMMTVMASAGKDTAPVRRVGEKSTKQNERGVKENEYSAKQYSNPQTSGKRDIALTALAVACTFLVVMIASVYFALPALRTYLFASSTAGHPTQIGLSVNRAADGQLDLSWNRDVPELAKAQGARLTITDGSLYKEVNMDNTQLHLGKLAYFSNSPDVQFRLEVYLDSKRSLAESVRVISAGSKTTSPESISQSSGVAKVTPISVHSRLPSPPITTHEPSVTHKPSVVSPSHLDSKPRPSLNTNSLLAQMPTQSPPPEIPSLPAAEMNSPQLSVMNDWTSAPPFPTAASAAKTTPVMPQPGNTVAYVPPRPVKKVMPNGIYLGQSPVVYETTEIRVQANIDATGRVTDAHAVQNGKKTSLRLTSSAVSAAKQWQFEPATIHGKPIAVEHMLVFVFRPSSQQ